MDDRKPIANGLLEAEGTTARSDTQVITNGKKKAVISGKKKTARKIDSPRLKRQKVAVLVAGMHRSGTSALTRCLSLLGCDLPKTLVPASRFDNELGFWESEPIIKLNEEILASAGSTWNDWTPFNPDWFDSPGSDEFRERAQEILKDEFGNSRLFVLKEPRICRLLGFWIEAVQVFGATPLVVSPIRNPLEVAASLERRNKMDPAVSQLIWLRHVLDAEFSSRGLKRAYVRYDDILREWQMTAVKLGKDLGISWPRRSMPAGMEIEAFLSPAQRHHVENDASVFQNPNISRWIRSTFEIVDRWAHGTTRKTDLSDLDQIRAAFDEAVPAFIRPIATGQLVERKNRALEVKLATRDTEAKELAAKLQAEGVRGHELQVRLATRDIEARELAAMLQAERTRAKDLQEKLASRDTEAKEVATKLQAEGVRASDLQAKLTTRDTEAKQLVTKLQAEGARANELQARLATRDTEARELAAKLQAERVRNNELQAELATRDTEAKELAAQLKAEMQRVIALKIKLETRDTEVRELATELVTKLQAEGTRANDLKAKLKLRDTEAKELAVQLQAEGARTNALKVKLETRDSESREIAIELVTKLQAEGARANDLKANLKVRDTEAAEMVARLQAVEARVGNRNVEVRRLAMDLSALEHQIRDIRNSTSWRITKLLRAFGRERPLWSNSSLKVVSAEFDREYYLKCNPDVVQAGVDPVNHYFEYGAREGRNPSPVFVTEFYLERYPDVIESGLNPYYHYLAIGRPEGREAKPSATPQPVEKAVRPADAQAKPPVTPQPAEIAVRPADTQAKPPATPQPVAEAGQPAGAQAKPSTTPQQTAASGSGEQREDAGKIKVQEKSVQAKAATPGDVGALVPYAEQYAVVKAEFDVAFYLRRYMDIAVAQIDPVTHYVQHGGREGRDPTPEFVTKYYVERYPDARDSGLNPFYHYLTIGRAEGRATNPLSAGNPNFDALCEVIGRAPTEMAQDLADRRRDLRARFESGVLGDMVARAGALEPLIHHSRLAAMTARFPPFHYEPLMVQTAAMHRLHEAAGRRRARVVVVIPCCRLSGAARTAANLATELAAIYGPEELVILRTDLSDLQFPEWFPTGSRHVDFATASSGLKADDRERLMVEFIRSLRPAAVFNVNSRLFWDSMRPYGKALASSMALYTYLFCNDKNIYGEWGGYPARYFYRYFDIFRAVITDSKYLAEELRTCFQIPPEQMNKLVALDAPMRNPRQLVRSPEMNEKRRAQIFWGGRFDRQKRLDVVFALASRFPEIDFRLWGEPVLDKDYLNYKRPDNVILEGVYKDFNDVPLERCDLWLHTSEWDGVPTLLIDVAATGVPLVGSVAGGCGEVLVEGLCHRIADVEDVDAFERAIRTVLADPAAAREKAARLRDVTLARRAPAAYRAEVEKLLAMGVSP